MNDLVGLLVVIMVVCFGQALLYSEASLPVGIAWIFSCRQILTTAALHIHPHQWSSSVHRLYALDSTHIAPVRIQKMDDSVRYCRHLQNHATLTYINSESACPSLLLELTSQGSPQPPPTAGEMSCPLVL